MHAGRAPSFFGSQAAEPGSPVRALFAASVQLGSVVFAFPTSELRGSSPRPQADGCRKELDGSPAPIGLGQENYDDQLPKLGPGPLLFAAIEEVRKPLTSFSRQAGKASGCDPVASHSGRRRESERSSAHVFSREW